LWPKPPEVGAALQVVVARQVAPRPAQPKGAREPVPQRVLPKVALAARLLAQPRDPREQALPGESRGARTPAV
jgi:hypothetical protein